MTTEWQAFRDAWRQAKTAAVLTLREYAAVHTPDVPTDFVDAVAAAVGDISIDEAVAALVRCQDELS